MSRGIDLLHPELIPICHEFMSRCKQRGLIVGISQTYRTRAEQEALYAQGRTTPGSIVTNAQYPYSPHCWGLAFDIYRDDGQGAYNDKDSWFARCGQLGKPMGLFWGGDFRTFTDKPHFELAKYLPNNSCRALIAKYGTPENFKETWEDDALTQEQFDKMMEAYLAGRAALPASAWAEETIKQAVAMGITDGSAPRGLATREEVMAMVRRALDAGTVE